jgi:hypothetical protein
MRAVNHRMPAHRVRPGVALAACVAAALLLACGGGGGSGGRTESPITITPEAGSTTYTEQLVVGDYLTGFTVKGRASGNLDLLHGKTIYIWVDDPNGIFGYWDADTDVSPLRVSPNGAFELGVGASMEYQLAPAHYSGVVKLHAGLSNHGAEFNGSPIEVQYDIRVRAGLDPESTDITVNQTFGVGDPAHVEVVDLRLPPQTESWTAELTEPASISSLPTGLQKGTDGTLTITLHARPPGTYTETIHLTSQARGSHYNNFGYEMDLHVTQVVAPNDSALAAFEPPEIAAKPVSWGAADIYGPRVAAVANYGVFLDYLGIEYLTHPPEADGHPLADDWVATLWTTDGATAHPCFWDGSAYDCLPPGHYTARLHYGASKDAVYSDLYQPITMDLAP